MHPETEELVESRVCVCVCVCVCVRAKSKNRFLAGCDQTNTCNILIISGGSLQQLSTKTLKIWVTIIQ